MKLSVLTTQYVAYKQDMGMRFHTEARTLQSFCRTMGDIDVVEVTVQSVLAFIAAPAPSRASGIANTKCFAVSIVMPRHAATLLLRRFLRSFLKPRSLSPTSSRTRNCSGCLVPPIPVARVCAASCNPTLSGC